MALTLSLPALDAHPTNPPETRPAKVVAWLDTLARRDPAEAARAAGDALASTNRVAMNDSRRYELAELYWRTAHDLWPLLERRFAHVSHPLSGDALEAAKAALSLSHELSVAYKHLLTRDSERRLVLGGPRHLAPLVQRCLQSMVRTITTSYLAYSPVPPKTWLDAHRVYAFARDRSLHQQAAVRDQPETTPERIYVQALLLALANPYGLAPGQLATVMRYLQTNAHWAKLTDVQPVHRMAKAVAIIPIGHDFPPFSANKGGAIEGRKLFLLTYDLAFQIQEQLRALEAGAEPPSGTGRDADSRRDYIALVKRLLRQWAIPPARQFNRVPSRARVSSCAGLETIWQFSRAMHDRSNANTGAQPPISRCEVINHTPAGYALRQIGAKASPLRIGELVAIAIEGRGALQVAILRWFRNTLQGSALEFGCELLSESPEPARAAPEGATRERVPVLVLPQHEHDPDAPPPQLIVPADTFRVEQAITLERGGETGFAVLTKLAEQGPGFELYDYIAVG